LDGDSDRLYLLKGKLKKGGGATGTAYYYYLRPNAATTNLSCQTFSVYQQNNAASGQSNGPDASNIQLAGTSWATGYWDFIVHMSAERSVARMFNIKADKWADNGSGITQASITRVSGRWNETSTNLTSLVLYCNQSNGFGVGSEFHLYKIIV
jgi:hypothetical protein